VVSDYSISGKRRGGAYKDVPLEKASGTIAKFAINTESKFNCNPRIDLEASLGSRGLLFANTFLICRVS